jgi:hypothetical protein
VRRSQPPGTLESPVTKRASILLAAAACAVLLSACGGGAEPPPEQEAIPRAVAENLARQADAVAERFEAGATCEAAQLADELQASTIDAVNAGDIPADFQEELQATANELVNEINCPAPEIDCDALRAEKDALEQEKDDAKGKGKESQLEERIKELEEQIKTSCEDDEGDGEGED